jgi:hypothetical protein
MFVSPSTKLRPNCVISAHVPTLMVCLVQEKLRRERYQREKKKRNMTFLLLGIGEKQRREKIFVWDPLIFVSLLTSEESGEKMLI